MPVTLDTRETIAALATAPGPGGRAIVRLSGWRAIEIAAVGFHPSAPGRASSGPIVESGSLVIEGLRPRLPVRLARWPAPRTYTGQDMAEIHCVGSPPLVDLLLTRLYARGARPAERGEFTLRAFLAGKLDLTQAEAVLAVIHARAPGELEHALERLAGGLAHPLEALRERLLDLAASLEAGLDFSEEPDVDEIGRTALAAELARAAGTLMDLAGSLRDRDRPLGRPRVVLVGPPNAGKSRLYNALVGADRAIVSPHAGTTRDVLTAALDCDGMPVELVDTAGYEAAPSDPSGRAQALRDLEANAADLVIDCRPVDEMGESRSTNLGRKPALWVWTKADLAPPADSQIATSAITGAGLAELKAAVKHALEGTPTTAELGLEISARARQGVAAAAAALERAATALARGEGDEIVVFDVHHAVHELGAVLGRVVEDDVLDRVFSRFCIGK